MKLVNLTNRTLRLYDPDGLVVLAELPTTPPAIEAEVDTETVTGFNDVPVVEYRYRLTSPLPPPVDGVVYVVGWPVIQALAQQGVHRMDVISPDTSRASAVRDVRDRGVILGVRRFRVAQVSNNQSQEEAER